MEEATQTEQPPRRVAVVIPAKDEADRIAQTVRSCRAIPNVDLLVVVDDGSEDDTAGAARAAGATVVRHSVNRGKASAMETGAKVVAMRDSEEGPKRLLLFLDADLGESAAACGPLVDAVVNGDVDCAIAALPRQAGAGGHGFVTGLARRGIEKATGWSPAQPLSGQRCLKPEAFFSCMPLAHGWGVETGMTIDLLVLGFSVQEVPCDLQHRATGNDLSGYLHRLGQYRDVWLAIWHRKLAMHRVPRKHYAAAAAAQKPGTPYKIP